MTPIFYLGLTLGLLGLPFGFAVGYNCGFNSRNGDQLKRFNDSKGHRLVGVVE